MNRKRIAPGPGQESVWDYPRPPAVEAVPETLRVVFAGREIARTSRAYRVLETSHPPTYYLPLSDIDQTALHVNGRRTVCEYKGAASYYDIEVGHRSASAAAWYYPDPRRGFEPLKNCVSFYATAMDECWVGDEKVEPQEGDFYGGWITSKVVGPFKGGAGTWGW